MHNIAYGITTLLTIAGAVVDLLYGPVLLVFALTALALVGLAWVLGQATESVGSVISNVLLVLGASLLIGGIKNGTQNFSPTIAGANSAMLACVAFGLALPTVFGLLDPAEGNPSLEYLSISGQWC